MRTQVYAVAYNKDGTVVLATKNEHGYYFSTGGGVIVPAGKALNGGGLTALPGGRLDRGEQPIDGAIREFLEETSVLLSPGKHSIPPLFLNETPALAYFGVYILFNGSLKSLVKEVNSNLAEGQKAAQAVIDCKYGKHQYAQLRVAFPKAPADNELASMTVLDLTSEEDWNTISTWKGNPTLGWYYNILDNLRARLLGN